MPAPLNAGYMLMYRHLTRLGERHKIYVITDDNPKTRLLEMPCEGIRLPDQSQNLLRRFLAKIGLDPLWVLLQAKWIQQKSNEIVQTFKPDIIVSIWHSSYLLAAFNASRQGSIPFAVIVHDDWHEMINRRQWSKGILKKSLKKIFQGACARICISESIAATFHKRYGFAPCEILPPIPSEKSWHPIIKEKPNLLRIGTFGELMGNLGVLQAVAGVLPETGATLTFFTHGQSEERNGLANRTFVFDGGSLAAEDLVRFLAQNVDLILIPQSFESEHKAIVQQCFPSKIPEACQIGLPILTIGPEYGTAYQWARHAMPQSLVVKSLNPEKIASAISSLKRAGTRL